MNLSSAIDKATSNMFKKKKKINKTDIINYVSVDSS